MRAVACALALVTLVMPLAGAEQPAAARLRAAARAAVERAPELAAARAAADTVRAGAAADGAAGHAYSELQQEGIGPGFAWRPNAQTTFRVGLPFNLPWQASAARELREAAATAAEAEIALSAVTVAERAGSLWLQLAAAEARLEIATRIRERLDRALALHEERYSLGEVAGFDVVQLDVEQVRAALAEARERSDRDALLAGLRLFAGEHAPAPGAADLESLVPVTSTPSAAASVASAPRLAFAAERADTAAARSQLVDTTAWGRPTAEAEWERVPDLDGMPGFDALGLMVNVPLPFGRAVAQPRLEAAAAARLAAAEAELARRLLEESVAADLARAAGAERRLVALKPVLERLEQAEHSLSEQFRLGAQSYLVYLDGMARFDDLRMAGIAAREDLLQARLRLAASLGRADLFPIPIPEPPSGEVSP